MTKVIICGGGLAGGLAALALSRRRPDLELLLIEQDEVLGGNHTWSFFDSDLPEGGRWLLDEIARRHWPDHEIRFVRRSRVIPLSYNSIRSSDFDAALKASLEPSQVRLGLRVTAIGPTHVIVGEERIEADCVIDARGPVAMGTLELGWQKFVGQLLRFEQLHNVARPMIMDATVAQIDGYRFVYLLPLSATELLVEDTYYSASPILDFGKLETRLSTYVSELGRGRSEVIAHESGVLPLVISGSLRQLWPEADGIPRLGLRGGFFHPTTGYSLPDAVATALVLAEQKDWSASAITALLRGRSAKLWRERRFFQLLNRMLFRACEPENRYRVLEHFYRLPPATIARFYGARLNFLDKLRILSGRSPVPIGRALAAIRGQVA